MSEQHDIPEELKMLLAMTPQELRVVFTVKKQEATKTLTADDLEKPAYIAEYTFKGPETDIPIRVYTPEGTGPFPGIVFYHGGGWIFGDIEGYDSLCRAMCVGTGAVVISVAYRLAPEAKFPAPAEDAYAALAYAHDNAKTHNIDPERIAVSGDSAGGNLAAAVTLITRDRHGPKIKFQSLIYPSCNVASFDETQKDAPFMKYFADAYLKTPEDAQNLYASPIKADLNGLPPAFLLTCDTDTLRDDGRAYAQKLNASGVPCEYINVVGLDHGFIDVNKRLLPAVAQYQDAMFASLKAGLQ